MEYTNDQIREIILQCLYDQAKKSKGPAGIAVGIRDLTSAVKEKNNIKQQDISANLQFLIKNNYVDEKEVQNAFATAKFGAKPAVRYELSQTGLSYFEQGSKFDLGDKNAGININMLNSVAVLGNQNVVKNIVRQEYRDGYLKIEELGKKVNLSSELNDEQKVDVQADLETIKNQLAKSEPNKGIVQSALSGISFIADIVTLVPYFIAAKDWIINTLHLIK
jgi:hypothetical protein